MAHKEQQDFCNEVKKRYPDYFDGVTAIDIGSLDVNGNNRGLFTNSEYVGLDIAEGKNVDVVSIAHKWKSPRKFDTVLSTEALEHDMHYDKTLRRMAGLTKSGGLMFFTAATTGREEHGTIAKHTWTSPNTTKIPKWQNYYKNLTEDDIRAAIEVDKLFSIYEFQINQNSNDIYFWGIKK